MSGNAGFGEGSWQCEGSVRRAQAYMATQDYIEARQDLNLAIKSEPTNRFVLFAQCCKPLLPCHWNLITERGFHVLLLLTYFLC